MRLTVPGRPVPAARPRIVKGHAYYPPKYQQWKEAAAWQIRSQGQPITGPVKVVLRFHPDSVEIEVVPGDHRPAKLWGDVDNLIKSALDSLVAGGVLEDDRMVTVVEARLG